MLDMLNGERRVIFSPPPSTSMVIAMCMKIKKVLFGNMKTFDAY